MPLSAARCVKAQFLSVIVLVALSPDTGAQPDGRDDLIEELRQHIEALEKRLGERSAPPPPPAAAPPAAPAAAPPAGAPRPPTAAPKPSASEEAGREDEGGRALERTLVREGGLVLPRKVIELEPRLQYTYRAAEGLNLVTVAGVPQAAQQDLRRDDVEASVGVRVGLAASLQFEARLPYVWIDQNRATASVLSQSERVSGWGDVELGISKQLSTKRRGGLLGSLTWKSTTGNHEVGRLSPGSGFPQLQAAVTAVTREDPLVFFLSPSYSWVFEREKSGIDVDPGDAVGLKAGTILAASPETSLRLSVDLSRAGRTRIAGADVPGSDTTVAIFEFGVAKLLTRRTLVDVHVGIGLTPDAPDFRLRLALPIRFAKGL
jgi:hypothetical protein